MSNKGTFKDIAKNIKKDVKINLLIKKDMQLKYLVEGTEALASIMQIKLPVVLSYKLSLFIKKVSPELDEFGKKRNELLKEYAEPVLGEDGKETGQMKFKGQAEVEEFNKEINALLDQEVKIELPEISITEFGNIEIEPKQLMHLDWLIKQ